MGVSVGFFISLLFINNGTHLSLEQLVLSHKDFDESIHYIGILSKSRYKEQKTSTNEEIL